MKVNNGSQKILFAASEIFPYVKTGGLGDVAGALPLALTAAGVDIRLFVPGYPAILDNLRHRRTVYKFDDLFGRPARLLEGILPNGLQAYALDCPYFYDRSGPYLDAQGRDWPDNHLRFAAFCQVAALAENFTGFRPDILHSHDWQGGLIPAYLRQHNVAAASVFTIHNIAYQGIFPATNFNALNLRPEYFSAQAIEYYGQVSFLKAGLQYADAITTVSPTYAREIQTADYGCGMEGVLQARAHDLHGILNGIDHTAWDPAHDPTLDAAYDATDLRGKKVNRDRMLARLGLGVAEDRPLFGVVSRLVPQKGLDLLLETMPALLKRGAGFVVLGTGDADLEQRYAALAAAHPAQIHLRRGYDEDFAHQIIGSADAVLVPSRFEPCGLVQLYGLRYGTLPVVRRTGGLADSVQNRQTGFVFDDPSAAALQNTLFDVMEVFQDPPRWQEMQRAVMAKDFGWQASAQEYLTLYASLRKIL